MLYAIEEITSLIGARRYGNTTTNIEWLLTDSRSLTFPETTLFFAIKTRLGDGANYIQELYHRGVRNFVVEGLPQDINLYKDCNFLKVSNSLTAIQQLAERHREKFLIPIIGITGSNGKTIVKEWISHLLCSTYNTTRSPKSYNSQIGVPLSVWLLNEKSQIGIFEAGISQKEEMQKLRHIIQPTIGIITNIGQAHQENFENLEEKCEEKLKLFSKCETVIFNADDPIVNKKIQQLQYTNKLWLSFNKEQAPLYIYKVEKGTICSTLFYQWKEQKDSVNIPFTDEASIQNAALCLLYAKYFQLSGKIIKERFACLPPVAMRLNVIQGKNNCTIINDSYNSDLTSLNIAIDFMQRRKKNEHTSLIISDILQSGMDEETLYTQVANLINSSNIDRVITVGDAIGRNTKDFHTRVISYNNTEALIESGILNTINNETVLIKGARQFGFDNITALLEQKMHQTILKVNLNAIVANLNHYRNMLKKGTKMVCMVKASAYGAGASEIAHTLQEHGVDYLAVAVADEGAILRKDGITQGIMVMNPEENALQEIFDYDLEPEVFNFSILDQLIKAARQLGLTNWPIHIKLDTGMHRLGFNPETDIEKLIQILQNQNELRVRSIFSHFVGSDSADFNSFSEKQFEIFNQASLKLQQELGGPILRHICNSAAIERFPQYHLDMVRLGIGLYGIDPSTNQTINNVSTLQSIILQIRDVNQKDTVGYSRKGVLTKSSRIAAVPIGYADGLNRHLGRGNCYCLVNGKRAPYVGNICMDVCMIDVSNIDCKEGDNVTIFGDELPVTVLSDALDTIPYEVLTSVSERVPRVYYQD